MNWKLTKINLGYYYDGLTKLPIRGADVSYYQGDYDIAYKSEFIRIRAAGFIFVVTRG